jgi:basic membrane lipoprotein Med (substrate-binding protein (PBP1-ABC) superfamily)
MRMTIRILPIAGLLALAIFAGVQAAPAASPERRVVVVVDAAAGRDPAVLDEARAAVARAGSEAQLRVPRTATEQLSVTHYFAAKGYTLVVGVGLDDRHAVAPVEAKYPRVEFVSARPGHVAQALAG